MHTFKDTVETNKYFHERDQMEELKDWDKSRISLSYAHCVSRYKCKIILWLAMGYVKEFKGAFYPCI